MFTKELFTEENFHTGLVEAVGNRLASAAYTDAVLAGIKYLTDTLRRVGGVEGDGAQLVGQVLGGNAPLLSLNKLRTVSEKDEQKGIEQLLRGIYVGIRNPRTHEVVEDTEDFALRALTVVDLALQYLERKAQEFDVDAFVNRIYEPHFVPSSEYAQALVADLPANQVMPVFAHAFARREKGDTDRIRYAFHAIYQLMSPDQMREATHIVGDTLRGEVEPTKIAGLFLLLKPEAWTLLQDDVRMRMEHVIIYACRNGTHDVYSGLTQHRIGTWGSTFGRYFTRRRELAQALIDRLHISWYTQNFVGKYYMYTLPAVVTGDLIESAAEALAYAALGNKAIGIRNKLLEVVRNYPDKWKDALKIAVQERKESDPDLANKILEVLA